MKKLDATIERFARNAEYERTHGNLQGFLEFKQLANWLKELRAYRAYREMALKEHADEEGEG
jgi:hypothetical protein